MVGTAINLQNLLYCNASVKVKTNTILLYSFQENTLFKTHRHVKWDEDEIENKKESLSKSNEPTHIAKTIANRENQQLQKQQQTCSTSMSANTTTTENTGSVSCKPVKTVTHSNTVKMLKPGPVNENVGSIVKQGESRLNTVPQDQK